MPQRRAVRRPGAAENAGGSRNGRTAVEARLGRLLARLAEAAGPSPAQDARLRAAARNAAALGKT